MRKARDYCIVCRGVPYTAQCLCGKCVFVVVISVYDYDSTTMMTAAATASTMDDIVNTKLFTQSRAHSAFILYKRSGGGVCVYVRAARAIVFVYIVMSS